MPYYSKKYIFKNLFNGNLSKLKIISYKLLKISNNFL
jgi:hypothetical protein